METAIESNIVSVKLEDSEELISSLKAISEKYNIKAGQVLTGIGLLRDSEIGFLVGTSFNKKIIKEPHELLSLQGNIAYREDGTFTTHLHVSLAINPETFEAVGGVIFKGIVHYTAEIAIRKLETTKFTRLVNTETKLQSLKIE